jgi:hypothetical protein
MINCISVPKTSNTEVDVLLKINGITDQFRMKYYIALQGSNGYCQYCWADNSVGSLTPFVLEGKVSCPFVLSHKIEVPIDKQDSLKVSVHIVDGSKNVTEEVVSVEIVKDPCLTQGQ